MSTASSLSHGVDRAGLPAGAGRLSSAAVFAVLVLFWVGLDCFPDWSDPASLLPSAGSNTANQICITLMTLVVAWRLAGGDPGVMAPVLDRTTLLLFAWFAATAVLSTDPGLSLRRYVLTLMVVVLALGTLLLPRDRRAFATLLGGTVLVVLVLCYGGVLFAPQVSVHQATDLMEPEHAGDWRGLYNHKNGAGGAMVIAVFVGLYVARVRHRLLGWGLAVASGLFLVLTNAKTSNQMVLPILLLSVLVERARSLAGRAALIWGGLAIMNLVTLGSVVFAPVHDVVQRTVADPTFTNRTDVWAFVVGKLPERLWLGQGYDAFWGSSAVFFGESQTWANTASDAHNGYLDMLLKTGLPGGVLSVLWLVVCPTFDVHRAMGGNNDRATAVLFLRIWLFLVYLSTMESFVFRNGGPAWFMMLVAIFGLRLSARTAQVVRG